MFATLTPRLVRPSRLAAPLVACLALACGGSAAETIDREVFIATYVDLRMAALETDSARVATVERDAILERHGVSGDDLTTFVDVHADDLDFMRDVWNEVELRMDVEPEGTAGAP